jgi:RNA polymerase sigma-B factor
MKVVERFDPDRGVKFVSYATPSIVGDVKNYFRDRSRVISLPRRSAELLQKLGNARTALEQELLRAPTADELADKLGISLEQTLELLEMQGALSPSSLDSADEEGEKSPLDAFLASTSRVFPASRRTTRCAGRSCHRRGGQNVLIERYFHQRSQREVAETLGVSQMSVSRTERRALAKLREILREQ